MATTSGKPHISGRMAIWCRSGWWGGTTRDGGWTLVRCHATRPFALCGLLLSVAVLAGCGGVRFSDPTAKYSPTPAARDLFQTQVEDQLGASWMSRVSDHDSFRKGAQDLGDTACRNALAGHSRDDFQKGYLETSQSSANAGGAAAAQPDSVLNAQSLMFWSLAIRDLCPSVGPQK